MVQPALNQDRPPLLSTPPDNKIATPKHVVDILAIDIGTVDKEYYTIPVYKEPK